MNATSVPSREELQKSIDSFRRRCGRAQKFRESTLQNLQYINDDFELELQNGPSQAQDALILSKTKYENELREHDATINALLQDIHHCESKLELLNASSLLDQSPAAPPNQGRGEPEITHLPPLVLTKSTTKNRGLDPQYQLFKFMARTVREIDENTKLSLCNLADYPVSTMDGFDLPPLMEQLERPLPQVPLHSLTV